MNVTLGNGSTLTCKDDVLASGADGAMHVTSDGKSLVKLYHQPEPWREPSVQAILDRFNAVRGEYEAYWRELLCWPTAVVQSPGLGVVIPLAAPGLRKFVCYIVPKWLDYHPEDRGSFAGRLGASIKLARAVRRLHNKGLCHSDLSENNIFANANDGRAYVIDLDGLVVPDLQIARAVVIGTPGYIAPELMTGAENCPTVVTERHSLAVLIYTMLLMRHPLKGRKQHDRDPDRNEALQLGARALFVEHPTDTSNRPMQLDYGYQLLGTAVSKLVERAFVEGLHQPGRRPLPTDWERDLVHLFDTLVQCPNPRCPMKSFPLPDVRPNQTVQCPFCKTRLAGFSFPVLRWYTPTPNQIGIYRADGTRLVVNQQGTLHEWHIRPSRLPSPDADATPLAYFDCIRDNLGHYRWVLVNNQLPYLEAADPSSGWKRVRSAEAVELKEGRKLRFGMTGQARDAVIEMMNLL